MATRHEIPTHLGVEDRIVAGLTTPQLLVLLAAGCAAYAAWQDTTALPHGMRLLLGGAIVVSALIAALVRPHGQSLLLWVLVLLRYLVVPRVCLWQPVSAPAEPDAGEGMLPGTPRLTWLRPGRASAGEGVP